MLCMFNLPERRLAFTSVKEKILLVCCSQVYALSPSSKLVKFHICVRTNIGKLMSFAISSTSLSILFTFSESSPSSEASSFLISSSFVFTFLGTVLSCWSSDNKSSTSCVSAFMVFTSSFCFLPYHYLMPEPFF